MLHNSILVLVALKQNKACGPGTPAASGFTCPLCLWEKSSSTWTKPMQNGDHGGQQRRIPASFSKAPSQQALMSHQNLAEVLDKLSTCKSVGCHPAFITLCGGGDPADRISGFCFIFFPGLSCSHGGENETCTFASVFQLAYKFSFPFDRDPIATFVIFCLFISLR